MQSKAREFARQPHFHLGGSFVAQYVNAAATRRLVHEQPMKIKTLNGAPLREHLDFSAGSLLNAEGASPYLRRENSKPDTEQPGTAEPLKWRRLVPKDTRLRTGWSQPYLPKGALLGSNQDLSFSVPGIRGSFVSVPDDTTNLDTTLALQDPTVQIEDFVQHSLVFHETLISSQIAPETGDDRTVSFSSLMGTSFGTTSTGVDSPPRKSSQNPILQVPSTLTLTTLGSLPSAQHLQSIYPQTPTPNLLCVLTLPPEVREIFVRKGGYRMHLHEITVADNTKSGFKVSFWSRPTTDEISLSKNKDNQLVRNLERIKVGDILLLRNIALNSFRDTVYGQSLNTSIARVRTTIEVLMSSRGTFNLEGLPTAIVATFTRVKRWAKIHVAPDSAGSNKRKGRPEGLLGLQSDH